MIDLQYIEHFIYRITLIDLRLIGPGIVADDPPQVLEKAEQYRRKLVPVRHQLGIQAWKHDTIEHSCGTRCRVLYIRIEMAGTNGRNGES